MCRVVDIVCKSMFMAEAVDLVYHVFPVSCGTDDCSLKDLFCEQDFRGRANVGMDFQRLWAWKHCGWKVSIARWAVWLWLPASHPRHTFSMYLVRPFAQISEGQIYRQMRQAYHREVNAVSLLRQKKCYPPQLHASKSRIHPQNIGAVI